MDMIVQLHTLAALSPGKSHGPYWTGNLVGPTVVLGILEKKKCFLPLPKTNSYKIP